MQIQHGRPPPEWQTCNDEECEHPDTSHVVIGTLTDNGGRAQRALSEMAATQASQGNLLKQNPTTRSILAFARSPPVLHAFWWMQLNLSRRHLTPSRYALAEELAKVKPKIETLLTDWGGKGGLHEYLCPRPQEIDDIWRLSDFLIRFIIEAENWRRYQVRRGFLEWEFGTSSFILELHMIAILHMRDLAQVGLLRAIRRYHDFEQLEMWQEWLDTYSIANSHMTALGNTCSPVQENFPSRLHLNATGNKVDVEDGLPTVFEGIGLGE